MNIIVTGTPGTGKTTFAKKYAKQHQLKYIDVNKVIKDHNLSASYDAKRKCDEVEIEKLNKVLIGIINENKGVVIDSHLSHYLPKKYVDECIVMKCDLKTLQKRLEKRKYSKAKIQENLDAEIFEVCETEAMENAHEVRRVYSDED